MADEPPPLDVEDSPPPDDNEELSENNIFGKPSLDEPEPAKKEETKENGEKHSARLLQKWACPLICIFSFS